MLGTFDILYLLLAGLWGMQFFFFLQNGKEAQGVQASSSSLLSPIRDTKKRVHVTVSQKYKITRQPLVSVPYTFSSCVLCIEDLSMIKKIPAFYIGTLV